LIILFFFTNHSQSGLAFSALQKGSIAPDFSLQSLDGRTVSLSDFHGQTVILNFWASWCPPCKEEMPAIENFYQNNASSKITVLSVNLTSQDSGKQSLQQFVQNYSLSFPILLDEKGAVGKLYQILTIPTSFIISPEGTIKEMIIGPLNEQMMNQLTN